MRENPYAPSWTEPPPQGVSSLKDSPLSTGLFQRVAHLLAPPIFTGTGLLMSILLLWLGAPIGLILALVTTLAAPILVLKVCLQTETAAGFILVFFGESIVTLAVWFTIVATFLPDK